MTVSVDFPTAWRITLATPKAAHHPECSHRTHGMLCDCDVLRQHELCGAGLPSLLSALLHRGPESYWDGAVVSGCLGKQEVSTLCAMCCIWSFVLS